MIMRLLPLLVVGCTLLPKSAPLDVRYYSPELAAELASRRTGRLVALRGFEPVLRSDARRVRLGRIEASAHLRERIVYRESAVQVRLHDDRRWTENPEVYVRRSLARSLAGQQLEQAIGGDVPTVDVEVLAFEEIRLPAPAARVRLGYRLRDDRVVLGSGALTVEHPARDFETFVAALGTALSEATDRVVELVARDLDSAESQTTSR